MISELKIALLSKSSNVCIQGYFNLTAIITVADDEIQL